MSGCKKATGLDITDRPYVMLDPLLILELDEQSGYAARLISRFKLDSFSLRVNETPRLPSPPG